MKQKLLHVALISALCFSLYFSGLGRVPFYVKGEPREGTVVWAMYDTGDWILPLRNGETVPSKPPLFHWLGALVSRSFGTVDEFTVRLPSAFLGTAGVLLTYWAGAFFWNPAVGLVAALILATSFEWWLAAVSARVDMTLTFFLLCFFVYFYLSYRSGGGKRDSIVLGFLLGLAILAKGPLGLVLPCATVLLFLWRERDLSFVAKRLHPFILLVIAGAVAGSWYGLALLHGGSSFLDRVIYENFDSAIGIASHRKPFYYFVPGLFQGMLPWSVFLPSVALFLYHYRDRIRQAGLLYPLVWFGVVFVFFSAAVGKRTVYILPLYPAAALIFGVWLDKLNEESLSSARSLARVTAIAIGALFVVSAALMWLATPDFIGHARLFLRPREQNKLVLIGDLVTGHRVAILLWALAAAIGGIVAIISSRKTAWMTTIFAITTVMAISFSLMQTVFHPELAANYNFKHFMERVKGRVTGEPLFYCHSLDSGVLFYAYRNIPRYEVRAASGGPFYLLVWDDEWKSITDRDGLVVLDTSAEIDHDKYRHLMLVRINQANTRVGEQLVTCKPAVSERDDTEE
jgi:4-amino-4-deoxy-L-arabinose transferase-like glycosyltransferase